MSDERVITAFRETIRNSLMEAARRYLAAFHTYRPELGFKPSDHFTTKNKSEIMSKILELVLSQKLSEYLGVEVLMESGDADPDVYIPAFECPIEIKVTSGDSWRGGEYSKRSGLHLLVKWSDDKPWHFFAALLDMETDDWRSSNSGNYYATSFSKKELLKATSRMVLWGKVESYLRGTQRCTRISKLVI